MATSSPVQQYGRVTYGGSPVARTPRESGGYDVPGYDSVYYWSLRGIAASYGQAAYGGRRTFNLPAAGLFAEPDPAAGTVSIPLWWAYADEVIVSRRDADGTVTPLRDSPIRLDRALSRTNQASNPKVRDNSTGYTAGTNTTLSRLQNQTLPTPYVTTALRATATAAGTARFQLATEAAPAGARTYGQWIRTSALASAIQLSITWFNISSVELSTQTYSTGTVGRTQAVGAYSWTTIVVDSWPENAITGVVSYLATGLPAGGTMDITGRLVEAGAVLGNGYFDGDFPGAGWSGTPGMSASLISPITYAVDAEAPLDSPVVYELTNALVPGFVASSELITLDSTHVRAPRDALLTHPGLTRTIPVWVETEPEITRPIEQASFQVIGRRRLIVVTAPQRGSDTGSLTFVVEGIEERKRLLDMLDDGSPLLLRAPASYGHPPLWWLSFGDVSIEAPGNGVASYDLRRITATFTEVDRPSAATRPLVA